MSKTIGLTLAIVAVCFLAFAVSSFPLWAPTQMYAEFGELGELLGNPMAIAFVAAIACAGAAITMYVVGRFLLNRQPSFAIPFKLFVFGILALAACRLAAIGLAGLGVFEAPKGFFAVETANVAAILCGGAAGIAAMNSKP